MIHNDGTPPLFLTDFRESQQPKDRFFSGAPLVYVESGKCHVGVVMQTNSCSGDEFSIYWVCATLVLLVSVQGCATLSEADCLTADWAVMGEVDGRQGKSLSELNRYRRQCADYGVVPDTQAYMEARERGLALYCTHDNGYREGRTGVRNESVCPAALEPDFQGGYRLGRAVHVSITELRRSGDSIRSARSEIEDLRSGIDDREESLRSDDLDDGEQRELRDEIDSMNRNIDRLETNIVILTGTLAIAIADYRQAVLAARSEGHDEPMESELLRELGRLAQ